MPMNRLADEKSPYLLQHADNPVNWYPWGEEAFARARAEDKLVFLSIGYATCHWCHVMAHESFEDQEVAALLNENYVAIKVDREERPDLDQVYMAACQALTGQGGWPLSVFLTPEGQPVLAGTYYPKTSRYGRPGFMELLTALADKWRTDRQIVLKSADQLTEAVRGIESGSRPGGLPGPEALEQGYRQLSQNFDSKWKGFGRAPKFPTPHYMNFLLRHGRRHGGQRALEMAEETLAAMRRGGIFDHLGLGFHRYSVDEKWLVPHFEKMLYDQALLAMAATEIYQRNGDDFFAGIVRDIFAYVLRDMTSQDGAFYAAEDADSEGQEGTFYVWRPEEIKSVLGDELGDLFNLCYDVTPQGNFEHGLSILNTPVGFDKLARRTGLSLEELETRLAEARERLYEHREKRPKPFKDDKILTAWNGLMIAALAKGAQALGRREYAEAAAKAADFILAELKTPEGVLLRRHRHGEAEIPGFLEDYAFFIWGLIELYEAAYDIRYLEEAVGLAESMLGLFRSDDGGAFYFSGRENEALIARTREAYDGAIPSGNSVAALDLLRLGRLTGRSEFEEAAVEVFKAFSGEITNYPMAHTHMLMALDFLVGPSLEIVIVEGGDREQALELAAPAQRRFNPNKVVLFKPAGDEGRRLSALAPYVEHMKPMDGRAAVYICQNFACQAPTADPADLDAALL